MAPDDLLHFRATGLPRSPADAPVALAHHSVRCRGDRACSRFDPRFARRETALTQRPPIQTAAIFVEDYDPWTMIRVDLRRNNRGRRRGSRREGEIMNKSVG